jgi:hypothetical protein
LAPFSDQLLAVLVFIGLFGFLCRFVVFLLLNTNIGDTHLIQKWLMKTYWSYHLKTKSVMSSSCSYRRKQLDEPRKEVSPHKSLDDSGERAPHFRVSSRFTAPTQEQIAELRGDNEPGCAQSERRKKIHSTNANASPEAAASEATP